MAEQSNQPGIKDLYKVLSDIEQRHDAEVKRLTEEKQKLETSLRNEIETRTEQSKRLQSVEENLTEYKKIINSTLKEQENLQHELKEKTDEVTRLHYAKRDVEHTIDVYIQDNKRLILEAADLRNTSTKEKNRIEELIKDIKAAKQEIAQLQRTDTAYKKKLKEAEQKLTRTETACKKTLQEAEQKLTRAYNETQTAKDELKRAHNDTQTAKDELERLQSELAIALKDRDDYQVRLSALMATKLTTNKPEITDLSDINRPTKLAEQWSELFDNEHTDLYEALQYEDEKNMFLLLKLLKRSFEICQEIREQGVDWLSYSSENNTMQNPFFKKEEEEDNEPRSNEEPVDHEDLESAPSKGNKNADDKQNDQVYGRMPSFSQQQSAVKIDDNQKQTINRYSQTTFNEMVKLDLPDELKRELMLELSPYRKKKALEFVDILNKKLPERIAKEFDMAWNTGDALDVYLRYCIRLCWLMGIQSPPVYIRFDEHDQATRQAKLDKHFYREYTKAGQFIDYVVWPPLQLHKDGPLLHRGVAQGTDSKD